MTAFDTFKSEAKERWGNTEHYYTCTAEILAGLGQMYVLDERFKQNIDKHSVGTADFASEAIKIYCK